MPRILPFAAAALLTVAAVSHAGDQKLPLVIEENFAKGADAWVPTDPVDPRIASRFMRGQAKAENTVQRRAAPLSGCRYDRAHRHGPAASSHCLWHRRCV